MRGAVDDPGLRAQFSAVIGILGMALVPFIHLTVYLFRTLHPEPVIIRPGAPQMPSVMLATLGIAFATYLILYLGFVLQRYAIELRREARREEAINELS